MRGNSKSGVKTKFEIAFGEYLILVPNFLRTLILTYFLITVSSVTSD